MNSQLVDWKIQLPGCLKLICPVSICMLPSKDKLNCISSAFPLMNFLFFFFFDQEAITKYNRWGSLNKHLLLTVLEARESKIHKQTQCLVRAAFLLYPLKPPLVRALITS